jgi:hypothetical protein
MTFAKAGSLQSALNGKSQFDVQVKYHQKMLKNMLRLTDNLDYLWPINREMQIMKAGGSIDQAIANNVKAFRQFKETINV